MDREVEKLRGVVRDCMSKHLYSSAIFFADKVVDFTQAPTDLYMLAQALFLGKHYRRALHVLCNSKIIFKDLRFRYLAAKCLEEMKEWQQCLEMLGDAKVGEDGSIEGPEDQNMEKDAEDQEINITAAICFLRGKAYDALENRVQALQWYKAAIKADPYCYEALECLLNNHMLTSAEEANLVSSLRFGAENGWLSSFYSCLIKKYDKAENIESKFAELERLPGDLNSQETSVSYSLKNNADLIACKAEYYHQCGEYQKCFELTTSLFERDPFHLKCTLVHIATAMELGHKNELYLMACNLVKDYPQKAISWFAVGCYYYCIRQFDQSRRYFSKATSLDGTFAPAWIGFGNAFAAKDESDQAMAAFRTCARLFPGCHLPTLYIGLEYMRTHSYKIAEQFFMQAKRICPTDPLVYHELGVVSYKTQEYEKAVRWFEKTLSLVPLPLTETWEPTLVNMAHALRKLRRYIHAIKSYEKALDLSSRNVSTYAGLGYTYHLQNKFDDAIHLYHKALALKPDHQFCGEMLNIALDDAINFKMSY